MNKLLLLKFILFFTLILNSACSDKERVLDDFRTEINIQTSIIANMTRIPNFKPDGAGSFIPGDEIGLFISYKNNNQTEYRSEKYIKGTQLYWEDMNFPVNSTDFQFSASYPEVLTTTPENYIWDTAGKVSNDEKDLLLAHAVSSPKGSEKPIILQFRHALHKLVIKLERKDNSISETDLLNARVSVLGAKSASRINLLTGEIIGAINDFTITSKGSEATYLLPKQSISGLKLKFEIGECIREINFPNTTSANTSITELEDGKTLKLYFSVQKNGINLEFTDINGWESQGHIEGTIEI